jgi:hypothetical protein
MTQRGSLDRRVAHPMESVGAMVLVLFRGSQDIVVRNSCTKIES